MFDIRLTVIVEGKSNLKLEILDNAKIYGEKISLGKSIHKVLMETNTKEESLSRQHKEAFDLHQRQRLAINPDKVAKLYPWQQQALECIRKPSHREITSAPYLKCVCYVTRKTNVVQSPHHLMNNLDSCI